MNQFLHLVDYLLPFPELHQRSIEIVVGSLDQHGQAQPNRGFRPDKLELGLFQEKPTVVSQEGGLLIAVDRERSRDAVKIPLANHLRFVEVLLGLAQHASRIRAKRNGIVDVQCRKTIEHEQLCLLSQINRTPKGVEHRANFLLPPTLDAGCEMITNNFRPFFLSF